MNHSSSNRGIHKILLFLLLLLLLLLFLKLVNNHPHLQLFNSLKFNNKLHLVLLLICYLLLRLKYKPVIQLIHMQHWRVLRVFEIVFFIKLRFCKGYWNWRKVKVHFWVFYWWRVFRIKLSISKEESDWVILIKAMQNLRKYRSFLR